MAPCIDPKSLCPSCPTVMPSDICFDCGRISKFLVAYPELEASVKANQDTTGSANCHPKNINKAYTRFRRARKLEYRANKHLVQANIMSWQFNLDGRLRDEEVCDVAELPAEDITDSKDSIGSQTEDIQVYYDVWEDLAQDESALLDDDLNLHYLGRDLMESLDMAADDQSEATLLDDELSFRCLGRELMESFDMAADNDIEASDADDENSDYRDSEGSFAPSDIIVRMAQQCTTLQWEASLPVEKISRKAQGLYNRLCEWNFADATSGARAGGALVEDEEISPFDCKRKFSFEDEYEELDRGFGDGGDGYCSDSSSATVRNQLVECRRVVGGRAYEWDILL